MRETVWTFKTARFRVELQIEPEDMDPAEQFQFAEDVEAIRSGEVEWFQAVVVVYCDGRKVAWDALGGCAYKTVREFYESHWRYRETTYFTDMVRQAIAEARKALGDIPRLRSA